MPRQIPRKGFLLSRANLQVWTIPVIPLLTSSSAGVVSPAAQEARDEETRDPCGTRPDVARHESLLCAECAEHVAL